MEQANVPELDVVSDDPRQIPAASVGTNGSSTSHVVVAIPTFNEEIAIASLVLRAREHADKVLVIDDGSTDRTVELAKQAGAIVFENGENRGKGFSVQKAFSYAVAAEADCLVLMDGDGQHDPDEIPHLVDPITKRTNGDSVDVALGFRVGDMTQMPAWRGVPERVVAQAHSKNGHRELVKKGVPTGLRAFGFDAIEVMADDLQRLDSSIEAEEAQLAQENEMTVTAVHVDTSDEAKSQLGLDASEKPLSLETAKTAACIPAYNEEVAIGSVILRARKHVDEVIVVDDGSSDRTVEVAQRAGARVIEHETNKGYGGALCTIFDTVKREDWDAVAILDSDGQHDPDDLPRLLSSVIEGDADFAIGSRFVDETTEDIPLYRRLGIGVLTQLSNLGASKEHRVTDGQSGFRAFSRKGFKAIDPNDTDMGISAEVIFQARKAKLTFKEVPTDIRYDVDGSTHDPVSHGLGVIGSMVRYAEREHPLLVLGLPGFLLTVFGLLLAGYSLSSYFQTGFLPFGPTVGAAGLILTGMVVGMTGLILHSILNALQVHRHSGT